MNSQDAQFYLNRGNAYLNLKEYELAITDFDQTIKLNPNYPNAYYDRGQSYLALGKYDYALKDLTIAISQDPKNAYAYIYRALAYIGNGQRDLAITDLNKVFQVSTNANIISQAKKMLSDINNNLVVIPITTLDVPVTPPANNGTQKGNAPWRGNWKGTIEIVAWGNSYITNHYDNEIKGEFTFKIDEGDGIHGTGTIQGSFTGGTGIPEEEFANNFQCGFEVSSSATLSSIPDPFSNTPMEPQGLVFISFQPSEILIGALYRPSDEAIFSESSATGSKKDSLFNKEGTWLLPGEFPMKFTDGDGYEDSWDNIAANSRDVYRITIKIYKVS